MRQDGVDGRFLFTLQNPNEELLLNSSDHATRDACIEAIRDVIQNLPNKNSFNIQNNTNGIAVALLSSTGTVLGTSPIFATQAAAQTWIDDVTEDASDETNYQVVSSTTTTAGAATAIELPSLKNIDFAAMYDFSYIHDGANESLSAYQHKGNSEFYFNIHDVSGKAILFSRGFESAGRRNKRVRQVIDAVAKGNRFETRSENGSFYFIIKERNGLEIARSCQFASEAESNQNISYIQNILPGYDEKYPKAEKTKRKMVNQYDTTLVGSGENGFETMRGEDKGYYFIYNCGGHPVLFSQSYTSGAGRDNGIRSVIRNAGEATRYEARQDDGKHYFVLKSSNRQEIAQSAYFATEAEMEKAMGCVMESTSYAGAWEVDLSSTTTETTETFTLDAPVAAEAVAVAVSTEGDADGDSGKIADDYLNCREYDDHGDVDINGFTRWQHANGEYYFTWHNADGSVKMRSEGYPTTSARDNGMDSVMRNRDNAARYAVVEKMGVYFMVLKAGNHQEIARSCGSTDRAALESMFSAVSPATVEVATESSAVEVAAPVAMAAAIHTVAPVVAVDRVDDYMVCENYKGHGKGDDNGITKFQAADGQYYFTIYDEDGNVMLRSEGFRTEADRQVEYDLVVKHSNDRDRWNTIAKGGFEIHILTAPDGREIGRSCAEKMEVEAPAPVAAPAPVVVEEVKVEAPAPVVEVAAVAAAVAAVVVETPAPVVVEEVKVEAPAPVVVVRKDKSDDYMICEEYRGHSGKDANGITRFTGKDGQFYFTIYDDNGNVKLRSEGFATEADLKEEYDMVVKYRNDKDRYSTIEKNGSIMRILKTPEGREIGRSCLEKIVVEAPKVEVPVVAAVAAAAATIAAVVPEVKVEAPKVEVPEVKVEAPKVEVPVVAAAATVAAAAVAAVSTPKVNVDKEDDYMVCENYKGHNGKDANGITKFKGADGQYYFTIYDNDGKVQLRSEGFRTEADLKVEYDMVVKYRNDKSRYTTVEKNGYRMLILKTPEGREIGRSCLEKIVVAAPIPPVVPPVAAPIAAEAAAGGFKWWYLLPLLLLPLLYMWCNKPAVKAEAPKVTVTQPATPVTPTPAPTPAPAKVESCDLHWIFFDFDKSDLRAASKAELTHLAELLAKDKSYTALISAHTDSKGSDAYNIALSERRAKAARAFLATKGIDGARVKSEMSGEKDSFTDNDEADVKRQYNRRVELRIKDANGKEVCSSIAPDVK
jgi:outer membrane protein OmpA-like peptidoglycan-associated protein/uncharacterized protein YegP (UPF0339 family)